MSIFNRKSEEATAPAAEPFETGRRRELVQRIASLDASMKENLESIGRLGISRERSLAEGAPMLAELGATRGRLLRDWNETLAELAALA
jgi:hypothetical protein